VSRRRTRCVPSVHLFSRHRVLRVVFAHRAPLSLARPRLHRSARRRLMVTMTMRVPQNAATFCPSGKRHRAFARATSPSAVAASLPQNDHRGIHHASPVRPRAVVCTRPRISNLVDERQSRRSRRASHHRETDDDLMVVDDDFQIFRLMMSFRKHSKALSGGLEAERESDAWCWKKRRQKKSLSSLPSSPSSSSGRRRLFMDDTVTTKTIENVFKGKTKEHKKVGLGSYC